MVRKVICGPYIGGLPPLVLPVGLDLYLLEAIG
jgi:hypothetical protein